MFIEIVDGEKPSKGEIGIVRVDRSAVIIKEFREPTRSNNFHRSAKFLDDAFGHALYHTHVPPKNTGAHGRYCSRPNDRVGLTNCHTGQLSCPKVQGFER